MCYGLRGWMSKQLSNIVMGYVLCVTGLGG
jgi:hypothetical protein